MRHIINMTVPKIDPVKAQDKLAYVSDLAAFAERAEAHGNYGAAASTRALIAKVLGHVAPDTDAAVKRATDDDLIRRLERIIGEEAARSIRRSMRLRENPLRKKPGWRKGAKRLPDGRMARDGDYAQVEHNCPDGPDEELVRSPDLSDNGGEQ